MHWFILINNVMETLRCKRIASKILKCLDAEIWRNLTKCFVFKKADLKEANCKIPNDPHPLPPRPSTDTCIKTQHSQNGGKLKDLMIPVALEIQWYYKALNWYRIIHGFKFHRYPWAAEAKIYWGGGGGGGEFKI